jgi:putative transposase
VVVDYGSSTKTVYSAKYHLIWCPKYGRRVLVGAVEERLEEILGRVAEEVGAEILGVEVVPDHVHLLVEIPPAVARSEFMGVAKGRWCRLGRAELAAVRRLPCWWSPSWFCSTVGGDRREVVRGDVENHKQAA